MKKNGNPISSIKNDEIKKAKDPAKVLKDFLPEIILIQYPDLIFCPVSAAIGSLIVRINTGKMKSDLFNVSTEVKKVKKTPAKKRELP